MSRDCLLKRNFIRIENGIWGLWSEWEPCPVSCGGADQKRRRSCIFPDPDNKGDPCDVDDSSDVESRRCNEDVCSGNKNAG